MLSVSLGDAMENEIPLMPPTITINAPLISSAKTKFLRENKAELVTSLASVTDTLHMLDFSRKAQVDFLEWVGKGGKSFSIFLR